MDVVESLVAAGALDGLGDAGVEGALPVVEQPLEVRKESGLVEELRGLEMGENFR